MEAQHKEDSHVHAMPIPLLAEVFLALMALTALTLGATLIDWHGFGLAIALGIATVKAALVALYFMHLRYDSPFNAIVFVTALVFVWLFLGIVLMDSVHYQPLIETYRAQQVTVPPPPAEEAAPATPTAAAPPGQGESEAAPNGSADSPAESEQEEGQKDEGTGE